MAPFNAEAIFRDFIEEQAKALPTRVAGFDVKLEQILDLPLNHRIMKAVPFFFVHLVRRNLLRSVVSEKLLYARLRQGDKEVHRGYTPERQTCELDPLGVVAMIDRRRARDEEAEAFYGSLRRPYVKVTYEDFERIEDAPGALEPIFRMLEADPAQATLETDLVRQNPHPLSELIENFEAVERALRGTSYESMVAEPAASG